MRFDIWEIPRKFGLALIPLALLSGCAAKRYQFCVTDGRDVACSLPLTRHDAAVGASAIAGAPGVQQLYDGVWVEKVGPKQPRPVPSKEF